MEADELDPKLVLRNEAARSHLRTMLRQMCYEFDVSSSVAATSTLLVHLIIYLLCSISFTALSLETPTLCSAVVSLMTSGVMEYSRNVTWVASLSSDDLNNPNNRS